MKKTILTTVCIIAISILSSCASQNESSKKLIDSNINSSSQLANKVVTTAEPSSQATIANNSIADEIFEKDKITEVWEETVVINDCSVKNGPNKDYKDIGSLKYGDTVLLRGSYNEWFHAQSDKIDGGFWIEGRNAVKYDYSNRTFGVLTAEKVKLGQISLSKGNLIWILKRDSQRSYVRPVTIDVNAGISGWINNSDYTTKKEGVYFNEAFLKKDAKVYVEASEKSSLCKEFNELSGGYVFVNRVQEDGWIHVSAWGGIDGWVKNTDVYLP